ncbi:peptidase A4 family protein [Aspergillus nomiae NRRL 13137]|uniref:Peptidase A4 family protein n=1 Tax=Aspergillus nomiae NRRL (strain ATCC 15546 / NRRL 13137 / CBS 260.88 / M93) TaxID=1509407 RepID=A0A0L1ILD8_ASPN3|nr:peptidase A4 family protein [Aspergillus nomiae NRRL 13137]KNG80337.1 peptidase A4 family protein [Aspergillus nomiae NRRL 13137]
MIPYPLLFLAFLHLRIVLGALSLDELAPKINHLRSQRRSKPLHEVELVSPSRLKLLNTLEPERRRTYSLNWAGAVLHNPAPSAAYTYVSATITVPTPTPSPSDSTTYQAASAWVGIDGVTSTNAILQTGFDLYVIEGNPLIDAWYEWYPGFARYYADFTVNPGDVIVASVNVTAPDEGVCLIQNQSTGETVSETVYAPDSSATVVGWDAEWVNCAAYAGGVGHGLENATVYELVKNNVVVAGVKVVQDDMVITRFGV